MSASGHAMPWAMRLALPWLRHELPMWGKVYGLVGGRRDDGWRGVASVRGKLHGYTMALDLANWSERLSWCLGRYHDLPIQLALQQVLRPGDCFADIGANLGMLSLLAHRIVGERGQVIACEPNPRLRQRLESVVRDNGLSRLELVGKALGSEPGVAQLREFAGHTGWGSLTANGPDGSAATATWEVPVVRGDDLFAAAAAARPMVIKIDVEGFEVPVLRGLQRTLEHHPIVFVEIADAHQRRAGFSAAELRGLLESRGYRGLALTTKRRPLFGRALNLAPVAADTTSEVDGMFLPPSGALADRWPEARAIAGF